MDLRGMKAIVERLCATTRESSTVEFKVETQKPGEIGKYISALANSAALGGHDRAWMVWGVEDGTRRIKGTAFNPWSMKGEGNQSLQMWLVQRTSPKAHFDFHECAHPSGRVVMLEIHPPRAAPIAFDNIRYIRIDSHTTKLSEHPDKEARLWGKLGQGGDWSGELVDGASEADLDAEALAQARQRFTEHLIRSEGDSERHAALRGDVLSWDVGTFLNKARLAKGGRITRSALLLLGNDESAHLLSPADVKMSWVLRDGGGSTVSSQHFGIPFLLASERLFARIRNVAIEQIPDGTLFPVAIQQYDPWVVRETLHNAVAHQDYLLGGKINVVEYPDRLLFSNLGQFIPQSVEWMLEQQSPPEHYRNQWLVDGMIRLRMIDQVGSGIRRMFETQRGRFLPLPDYSFAENEKGLPRVEVTIPGRVLDSKYTQTLMRRSDLELRQVLLLDRVQKGVVLSRQEVAQLRRLGLVEGRYPRVFVSGELAAATGGQAQHIRRRGFDNRYYRDLLMELIREHGPVGPAVITELFMDKLPDSLSDTQKRAKIRNMTYDLSHRRGMIQNVGHPRGPGARWRIADAVQTKLEAKTRASRGE